MPKAKDKGGTDRAGLAGAQSKILLDSNSYFRLANNIRPLLFEEFGPERYCLYVLNDLQVEYDRQPRLKQKFPWVNEGEYRQNRTREPKLSRKEKADFEIAYDLIWDHVQTELPGPSRIDVKILCYGYVLGIPVVTDDGDMSALAEVFGIEVVATLDLLKLMLDSAHIDMAKVRSTVSYWSYLGDLPRDFVSHYRRLFGELPNI